MIDAIVRRAHNLMMSNQMIDVNNHAKRCRMYEATHKPVNIPEPIEIG